MIILTNKVRGSYTVEFYTLLPLIRKKYESGMIVAKIIYDELYNDGKITMTYNRFSAYFRKEITGKTNTQSPKKDTKIVPDKQTESKKPRPGDHDWEPISLIVGERKRTVYNPHTREIDPKDIL